jgi:hypothetical protein
MSIRLKAHVRNGRLEFPFPLELPDGEEVDVLVQSASMIESDEWHETAIGRLEEEWDNPEDAIYDNCRKLYGLAESGRVFN